MLQKIFKFNVLFAFENMFSTTLHLSVIYKMNDQLVILLFAPKYFMKSSVFNGIQWKNKTKFGVIKVIFTSGGRFKWLVVSTSSDFDVVPPLMAVWDTHPFIVINWPEPMFSIKWY